MTNMMNGYYAYSTPCGWCTKWDKKCDKKISCDDDDSVQDERADSEVYIAERPTLVPKASNRTTISN